MTAPRKLPPLRRGGVRHTGQVRARFTAGVVDGWIAPTHASPSHYRRRMQLSTTYREEAATVAVDIDVLALLDYLGRRAIASSRGESRALSGMVRARVVSRTVLSEETREYAPPEGFRVMTAEEVAAVQAPAADAAAGGAE